MVCWAGNSLIKNYSRESSHSGDCSHEQGHDPMESSVINKSHCRDLSYKFAFSGVAEGGPGWARAISLSLYRTNSLYHIAAANKSPCREFSYKQFTWYRVQLQTNHPVESSAVQTCGEFSTKQVRQKKFKLQKSLFREFGYKQVTR